MDIIDLRSDTVTRPTESMRAAMARAELGDDGYGDDPTVRRLEEMGAALIGKEAALFVPSGIFGNQLALFAHCPRGSEVILDDGCHIVRHEAGASSVIPGVQLRCVETESGMPSAEAIAARIRDPDDSHGPATSLVCLENAHSNGRALPLSAMEAVRRLCASKAIPIHLDGARIFNAAIALGCEASSIAACADSVMFCLSKGLCAPVGSLLAGSRLFIERARAKRVVMGGQMRQAGVLAACGIVALSEMLPGLERDHRTASALAAALGSLPGVSVDSAARDINMVFLRLPESAPAPDSILRSLKERGILANPPSNGAWRLVTHRYVGPESVERIADAFSDALSSASGRPALQY